MELAVLYYRKYSLGHQERVVFPLEAESVEQARSSFMSALTAAVREARHEFCLWGQRFVARSFAGALPRNEFIARYRRGRPEDIFPYELYSTSEDEDATVYFLADCPVIRTFREWLSDEKREQRRLLWVEAGEDQVRFLDELWCREIVLPAQKTTLGMELRAPHGDPLVVKPEWSYLIEGFGEDYVLVSGGIHSLVLRESESGYALCSTDSMTFDG